MGEKLHRTLRYNQRVQILERDDYVCAYCLGNAEVVDHVIPWSYSYCDEEENLVASCEPCNQIASNFVFRDFDDKREFIQTIRAGTKWKKKLKRLGPPLCVDCGQIYTECNDGATLFLCPECAAKEYGRYFNRGIG